MPKCLRYTAVAIFCLLFINDCFAQKHRKGAYKAIHKAGIGCPVFGTSKYPYQGFGVKLGDPFALTYKFYPGRNFALVMDIGSAASGLYYKHQRKKFSSYIRTDTLSADQNIRYLNHIVHTEWVIEGKLLYQHDVSRTLDGLQWYAGGGWQCRKLDVVYEYFLELSYSESQINRYHVSSFTMGPTAALGLEYTYPELPIAAFMEMELFADILENPGWMRFQGGVGLRYLF